MSPDPEKLIIRKRVRAWSIESRRRTEKQQEAADERMRAMYEARAAGIPLDTIAADAGVDRSLVSRRTAQWARRHGLPVIFGPRHASRINQEARTA